MPFPIHKNKNIVIIGDVMLDQFYYGKLENTSKEDPLAKILKVSSESNNLGGAGNVAMNVKSMSSNPFLISVTGDDLNGQSIKALCEKHKIPCEGIFIDGERKTTTKTRLYDGDQIIRYDQEDQTNISNELEERILEHFQNVIDNENIDGVILQDYNKGVLNKSSIKKILDIAKNYHLPVFVDPKKDNFFEYQGVTIFKPNLREINWALPEQSYQAASVNISQKLNCEITAVTLSEDGIYICSSVLKERFPSLVNEIVDVCGAGDTVITVLALSYLSKCNISGLGNLANLAAADVCKKKGVVPINYAKLEDLYQSLSQDKKKYDIV